LAKLESIHLWRPHFFAVLEGENDEKIESSLCNESKNHTIQSTQSILMAPVSGIHPAIKVKLGEWIKVANMKLAKMQFRLENSPLVTTHQLPSLEQKSQYKAGIAKEMGENKTTLSSFREYINQHKVMLQFL